MHPDLKAGRARTLRREFVLRYRQVGLLGILKLGILKVGRRLLHPGSPNKQGVHPFDLKYGTETSVIVQPWESDIPDERAVHAVKYGTAIVEVFVDMIASLSIPYEEFVFVDLGSGKGRAMLLASSFPFKQIIGVELSNGLHQTALRNIQIFKDPSQRCHKIQSVCEDAASFAIPAEKIVFYLFNPFDENVLSAVVSNIEAALRQYPRTIYVLYLKALHRRVFDQSKFFRVAKETNRYLLYEGNSPERLEKEILNSAHQGVPT